MTTIPKVAQQVADFERTMIQFPSARIAFRAFLECAVPDRGRRILLPAYVGWSPKEGSGVFDPVTSLGLPFGFYKVDRDLHVDLEHLEQQLGHGPAVVVLIHYFGHVDPAYARAIELARRFGALIVEDEAHAMLTDLFGGSCGRLGDVCLFSLHKMLPMPTGGTLVVNPCARQLTAGLLGNGSIRSPWELDLLTMARTRRSNAALLAELLRPLADRVDPLWALPPDEVPQTFAVKIRTVSRDVLYERMNAAGFGVVSLYHTLVDAIPKETFPASHELARCVMNFPVHQEASEEALIAMIEELQRQVDRLESGA